MKTAFIAEVSSNHNQDLNRCLKFIDVASEIGCTAIKFQLFKIRNLFAPEILAVSEEHRQREAWELPVSFFPELAVHCRDVGIQLACTPFYLNAVNELLPYVDFYKIASYELLWRDLLTACARTGKPIALSTGMATLDEVKQVVNVIKDAGCRDLTLLHCVSGYPTPVEECNLGAIETLSKEFKTKDAKGETRFGWSDHSVNSGVIYRAIHRWGSEVIEFHLELDGKGAEFKTGHCWLPEQAKRVIKETNEGFLADGNGDKSPRPGELDERNWRADPEDGLRPIFNIRKDYQG